MHLLEPISFAGRTARNRLMFGPHETNLARGRAIGDAHVAYYRRRAVGGVGTIVTETASVHPLDWPYERAPLAADCGPGWHAVADACRPHGTLVLASLGHAGLQGSSAYSQRETWAPSRVADAVTRELPKMMEADDIADVLDGFAAAAALARSSGLDGVELNAGQFSLIRQFLSGLTNQRWDEWGLGDDGANRLAFARAVIARVRHEVGDGVVGLRLSCDELAPWAGLTPDAASAVAAELAPLVDYLVVVRGSIYSADATRPDAHVPAGFNLDLVGQVRSAVAGAAPVVAQGSIVDWGQAEWALTDGRADAVEMTRALIADPDLPDKLATDRAGQIRPCLLCNQKCRVRDGRNPIVSCVVNPTTGFELHEPESVDVVRGVVHVVGAGPAGLEAARVAAAAGADVHVWESNDRPCSMVRVWTQAPGRQPLARIADWLESECNRLGVEFHLGHTVSPEQVADWERDGARVLRCTGGRRRPPEYAVVDGAVVLDALEALSLTDLGDGPVVIWDPIGGPIGISIAEGLAQRGDVSLVTQDQIAGTLLSLTGDLASASTRLLQAGVRIVKYRELRVVAPGEVVLEDPLTGERDTLPANVVIDAGHRIPVDPILGEPSAGDAIAPRTLHEAILEGRRVAIALADAVVGAGSGAHR